MKNLQNKDYAMRTMRNGIHRTSVSVGNRSLSEPDNFYIDLQLYVGGDGGGLYDKIPKPQFNNLQEEQDFYKDLNQEIYSEIIKEVKEFDKKIEKTINGILKNKGVL